MTRAREGRAEAGSQHQLELGSKSLLALFFALAIVCGMFFAFGYTLGKHAIPATFTLGSMPPARAAASPALAPGVQPPTPAGLTQAETNQMPATLAASGAAPAAALTGAAASGGDLTPATPAAAASSGVAAPTVTAPAATPAGAPPPATAPATSGAGAPAASPPPPATASAGQSAYVVQVFAGLQSDAQSLTTALQGRGYPVMLVPPGAGVSNLFRVQVGPYLTRDEARASRARLRADGYQAVIRTQ